MAQPRDLDEFEARPDGARLWRVVHLSDVHVVGERYGFRIESGRSGPRGNERLKRVLNELDVLHAKAPLDLVLITGDMTDAGSSAEWAEFLDAMTAHPAIAERVVILPGNHDLNIVDRANPARMDLPTSPNRRLRQTAHSVRHDGAARQPRAGGGDMGGAVSARRSRSICSRTSSRWSGSPTGPRRSCPTRCRSSGPKPFPWCCRRTGKTASASSCSNSNADTHFSFTNALGMVSAEQVVGIEIARKQYPKACWIIALHHHVVEYPRPAKALSERIGTALINGNWFMRMLKPLAGRAILMHGHRHIDWIGHCAGLVVVSAPSPVMEATNEQTTGFYIHTLAIGTDGQLRLLTPERITVPGEQRSDASIVSQADGCPMPKCS